MKKIILIFTTLFLSIIAYLYVATLISEAHKIAKYNIHNDPDALFNFGKIKALILVGHGSRTGPTGMGCTNLEYVVVGDQDYGRIRVRLQRESYSDQWIQKQVIIGGNKNFDDNCRYG